MRWVGAFSVLLAGGYVGFSIALSHRKEERTFRQIIAAINYMECELQYRLTPLPQLLGQASQETAGIVRNVLAELAFELNNQITPQVSSCMDIVLLKQKDISQNIKEAFSQLGQCLGRFDLQGQLKELDYVRVFCTSHLNDLEANRDARLRSYQTLGLCAGAALAILLL